MNLDNRIVHGLWIGKHLSVIELLCIHSFLHKGHEFHLWLYDQLETPLPAGTIVENANLIIASDQVFCYKNKNQFGHGKGSYAGFSDIFRYKLLHEHGGWWTDMDVVCLAPLDFDAPYVFRTHHDFPMVGNIMKCPPNSSLMRNCYQNASSCVDENNADWNLPIRILNDEVESLRLSPYIINFSNQDSWRYIRNLLYRNPRIPAEWKVLHLVNEEWRRNKINKNAIPRFSFIGRKINFYKIKCAAGRMEELSNFFRIVFPKSTIIQAYWLIVKTFWKVVRVLKKEKNKAPVPE